MSQDTTGLAPSVILVGMGEIAQVLARGFLKTGHPVVPVTRRQSLSGVLPHVPDAMALVLAVGEKDLPDLLAQIPAPWHERLGLLQNELLPKDWQAAGIVNPTVISIWFEKKLGKLVKQLMPSPLWGSNAGLMAEALAAMGLNARIIDDLAAMQNELVIKNVYILTTNIAGLKVGGDVETLWRDHQSLARSVALEVIALQEKLVGQVLTPEPLIEGMLAGFEGDPAHLCQGRTAAARLHRALKLAESFGLDLPVMKEIAAAHRAH